MTVRESNPYSTELLDFKIFYKLPILQSSPPQPFTYLPFSSHILFLSLPTPASALASKHTSFLLPSSQPKISQTIPQRLRFNDGQKLFRNNRKYGKTFTFMLESQCSSWVGSLYTAFTKNKGKLHLKRSIFNRTPHTADRVSDLSKVKVS